MTDPATPTQPAAANPAASAPTPTPPPSAPEAGKQPPWGKPENFDADKAWELIQNLRTEKPDPAFRAEFETFRQSQTAQRDALAAALGVKPEETSDTDKLSTQIESLRGQILSSEKRALSIEYKVPEAMLTASDAESLRAQAVSLAEFAQAAHYAATTVAPTPPAPAFQQNPGQGQGGSGQPADEYEKYYPSK